MTLDTPSQNRQDAILDAAFRAFADYGYRRTTMEDIARAAGMSRTALYLHFRNKDDIVRSLAIRHFDASVDAMEAALNQPGQSVEAALFAAFVAKDGKFMEAVLATRHGAELLEAGMAVSSDLVATGNARLTEVLARWLETQGLSPDLGTPQSLAETILAALIGLKSSHQSLQAFRAGEAQLAKLVARALG